MFAYFKIIYLNATLVPQTRHNMMDIKLKLKFLIHNVQ